jgi:hypothetical protein
MKISNIEKEIDAISLNLYEQTKHDAVAETPKNAQMNVTEVL